MRHVAQLLDRLADPLFGLRIGVGVIGEGA